MSLLYSCLYVSERKIMKQVTMARSGRIPLDSNKFSLYRSEKRFFLAVQPSGLRFPPTNEHDQVKFPTYMEEIPFYSYIAQAKHRSWSLDLKNCRGVLHFFIQEQLKKFITLQIQFEKKCKLFLLTNPVTNRHHEV